MPGNILVIDDEEQLRKLLARIISLEGFTVTEAATLKAAEHLLNRQSFEIILCDVRLPDGNGVEFIKTAKQKFPSVEIILLTAYGNIPDGIQAMKNGAFDYIVKGNDNDRVIPLLYQAIDKVKTNKASAIKINEKNLIDFADILGNSPLIKEAIKVAKRISPTDANVLLLGETGTGKEVFATAIHAGSIRSKNSFVAINCSAFPRELLESELFGHKAGAYTSAIKDKKGLVELADNGTLFLDEISEMNVDLQAKLLRVIETGEFIKVGDEKTSKVNLRIIAAGNRDLKKEIEKKHLGENLYYRLNVFSIELPPLRYRIEDVPVFAGHFFIVCFKGKQGRPLIKLKKLCGYCNNIPGQEISGNCEMLLRGP